MNDLYIRLEKREENSSSSMAYYVFDEKNPTECTSPVFLIRPYEYDSVLREICVALGWQGGTRQLVIDEIKRLRKLEKERNVK